MRVNGSWQRQRDCLNIQSCKAVFFMQCVAIKENLEEQQNVAIIVLMLSRVYSGTLNIQLRPFGRYIASP